MASYPDSIYSPRSKANRSGVVYDADKETVIFAEDFENDEDETIAIETELGTLPKGTFSDVKTRLDALSVSGVVFIIDGGGEAITTGVKGFVQLPFKCEIQSVALFADQSGDVVVDFWVDTYANFPPTVADTITASAKPTLSSAQKYQDSTLTGWTKTILAGSVLAFNVDSVSDIERLSIMLDVNKIA